MTPEPPSLEQFLNGAAPRWDAINFDIACSRCGYNLRMLDTSRCPECGLQFDWPDVIDAHFRRNPFLFEHNWRKRPIRSYFITIWKSLRPARFWRQLSIHERTHPRPLLFLYLSMIVLLPVMIVATAFAASHTLLFLFQRYPKLTYISVAGQYVSSSRLQYLQYEYDAIARSILNPLKDAWLVPLLITCGFLAQAFLLLMLRQTLGRCRVRNAQVLRVVAYSAPPVAVGWLGIVHLVTVFDVFGPQAPIELAWLHEVLVAGGVLLLFAAVPAYCLAIPLKHYLCLPRPRILACTAAGVAVLLVFTIYMSVMVGW